MDWLKVFVLALGIFLMVGCCSSKIPTQYITSGVIIMPDYTKIVKIDGTYCCIDTMIQDPEPGYMFQKNLIIPVTIVGYDCYENSRTLEFDIITLPNYE